MSDLPFEDEIPDELRAVVGDLRSACTTQPPPHVAAAHLARMSAAIERAEVHEPLTSRRRRRGVVVAASSVGVAAALVLTGGLAAAAGSLPGPLQDVVAGVVAPLGIDLPDDDDPARPATEGRREAGEPVAAEGEDPHAEAPASGGPQVSTAEQPDQPVSEQSGPGEGRSEATPNSTVPSGPSGGQGNQSEIPPGQSGEPGKQPDVPPGRSGERGNAPPTPPGQSVEQGSRPKGPPGSQG